MILFLEFWASVPQQLLYVLLVSIILDIFTGVLLAFYEKRLNSKLHYKGFIKKVGLLTAVLLGALTDLLVIGGTPVFTVAVIVYSITGEGLSILENLGKMGVRVPEKLKSRLEQVQKENDYEENKADNQEEEHKARVETE